MITTRTRVLSILAVVAMLVSMLACFVIPASAAAPDQEDAWKKVVQAIVDYNTDPDMGAVLDAYYAGKYKKDDNVDGEDSVEELMNSLFDEEKIEWKNFDGDSVKYPRYAFHEEFDLVGYSAAKGNNWSISAPADWREMVNVSATNEFEGYTFHVTKNIDFTGEDPVAPLNLSASDARDAAACPFNGTIEGHGYAFKNITVTYELKDDTKKINYVLGMIGKLGPKAKINEFGVDSGSITATGKAAYVIVATFGEPVGGTADQHAELNKVWSNAELVATSKNFTRGMPTGIVGHIASTHIAINGAYFSGKLTGSYGNYGLQSYVNTTTTYNSLDASTVGEGGVQTIEAGFHANGNGVLENCYSLTDPACTADRNLGERCETVSSPEEGAWKINSNTASVKKYIYVSKSYTKGEAMSPVYYTWTKDSNENIVIRPTGKESNRIVQVKVTDGTNNYFDYVNNGDTLKKDDLAKLVDSALPAEAVTVGDITGATVEGEGWKLTGDATFTVTIDENTQVTEAWAKYQTILDNGYETYLTNESAADLGTVAGTVSGNAPASEKLKAINELSLKTYETYNETENRIPGYSLVDVLGEYNENDVWAINEDDDWLAVIDASEDGETFAGYTFHVTDNINFNEVPMKPVTGAFAGTIEGHFNAFQNISITSNDAELGLINTPTGAAVINEFGVDSGSITGEGYVATFGAPNKSGSVGPTFNKVWSGATITSSGNLVAGIVCRAQQQSVTINGAYFFGKLSTSSSAIGIMQYLRTVYVYNTLSKPTFLGTPADTMSLYVSDSKYSDYVAINNFSVGAPIYRNGGDTSGGTTVNNREVDSDKIGAWEINNAQPAASGIGEVYFTINKNGDIRFGDKADRIVKYAIMENNAEADPIYANAGAAVDVAALLPNGATDIVVSKLVEETPTPIDPDGEGNYLIEGDVTVSYTIGDDEQEINNLKAQLEAKIAEIEALQANAKFDAKYFKTPGEGQIGMDAWLELATSEEKAELEAAVAHMNGGTLLIEINDAPATFDETTYLNSIPAFKDYDVYKNYQPAKANWLIVDKADWFAMDKAANDGEAGAYFENTTFHLIDDIDFAQDNTAATEDEEAEINTDYMWPLGSKGNADDAGTLRFFAGTINGHGYGFENVYIKNIKVGEPGAKADYINNHVGLFALLDGATITEFGINSGTMRGTTGTASSNVSTFGAVNEEATVTFNKVWSGATLVAVKGNHISALAGAYADNAETVVNVDGFTFYGTVNKTDPHESGFNRNVAYGVYGGRSTGQADNGSFKNIVINLTNKNPDNATAYLFGFTDEDAFTAASANISNVYGVGDITQSYRVGTSATAGAGANNPWVHSDMTEGAAAYEINKTNTGAEGDVYFKLAADGGIRPTGTETDKIVKVEATIGEETKTIYINANQAYTNAELRDALGYGVETTIVNVEVASGGAYDGTALTVTEDAAIVVTIDVCEHPNLECNHVDETNKHTYACGDCGYTKTESCTRDWDYDSAISATGESKHVAHCEPCGADYEETCQGKKVHNEDCTENDFWKFDCEIHPTMVEAEETKENGHDFEGGEGWKEDDDDANKSYRQCAHEGCLVKEYKIHGTASAAGITLNPKGNGDIVIDLPENLATAVLTFTIEGAYTITHVNGVEWNGGEYAVSNGDDVTVTIAADVTAVGGTFKVEVASAKANDAEGTTIEIPGATATIGFDGVLGDANGDGDVNLADALAALYVKAEKLDAKPINMKNADMNEDGEFAIADVYAIVHEWLVRTLAA